MFKFFINCFYCVPSILERLIHKKRIFQLKGITFITKAEDKCLSVAASSIISRYIFIKEFSKLGDTVNTFLKKGAGHEVDEIGVKIVQKYGFNKLEDIAKLNFKNTDKIKELLNNK